MLHLAYTHNPAHNLYPLQHRGRNLTQPWRLLPWIQAAGIKVIHDDVGHAGPRHWFPIAVDWFDHNFDWIGCLSSDVIRACHRGMRLLFSYREPDDPNTIIRRLCELANQHDINDQQIYLISGNTAAENIDHCRWFNHFSSQYRFDNISNGYLPVIQQPKHHKITCLSRTHKNWRADMVYNICRYADLTDNFISYGMVPNFDERDFVLWDPEHHWLKAAGTRFRQDLDVDLVPDWWFRHLPKADDLSSDTHNNHNHLVREHFADSYWNIVLETLLDSTGVFLSEKTFKPIAHGQSFVIAGCQGSLQRLRDMGYETFGDVIDESYDQETDIHHRFHLVFETVKSILGKSWHQLHQEHQHMLPRLQHNQNLFQQRWKQELVELVEYLQGQLS